MVIVRYGGKQEGRQYELAISDEYIVVRTHSRSAVAGERPFELAPVSLEARSVFNQFELETRFRIASVEVLRAKAPSESSALRDSARTILKQEPEIQFAGRVLVEPQSMKPVVYTENLFVKFDDEEDSSTCQEVLDRYGLTIKRQLEYTPNAYFVKAPKNTGLAIF